MLLDEDDCLLVEDDVVRMVSPIFSQYRLEYVLDIHPSDLVASVTIRYVDQVPPKVKQELRFLGFSGVNKEWNLDLTYPTLSNIH